MPQDTASDQDPHHLPLIQQFFDTRLDSKMVVDPFLVTWKIKYHLDFLKFGTPVSDKKPYANSADPDQTAPEGTVRSGSTVFAIPQSILRNNCIKSKI